MNNEIATMSFCGVEVFDYRTVDGIEGHFQYTDATFHLKSLNAFDGSVVEVYEDWLIVIWGDEGVIQKEFFIMDNEEFSKALFIKYPVSI